MFQMKVNSAPVFVHFPAKGKPKKADTMDIHRYKMCHFCKETSNSTLYLIYTLNHYSANAISSFK